MTIGDVITDALRYIGIPNGAKALTNQDYAFGLRSANYIFSGWNTQPGMPFFVDGSTLSLTAGVGDYLIGPGQVAPYFNFEAPLKIIRASIGVNPGDPNVVTYPLEILNRPEGMDNTPVSNLLGIPRRLTYINTYPNAIMVLDPYPAQAYTLLLNFESRFPSFTRLDNLIQLPSGYVKLLMLQLAIEIAPAFGATVQASTLLAYKEAKEAIRALNIRSTKRYLDTRVPGINQGRGRSALGFTGVYD